MELILETQKSKLFRIQSGYVLILKEGTSYLKIHYDPLHPHPDDNRLIDILVEYTSHEKRDQMFAKIDSAKVLAIMSAHT